MTPSPERQQFEANIQAELSRGHQHDEARSNMNNEGFESAIGRRLQVLNLQTEDEVARPVMPSIEPVPAISRSRSLFRHFFSLSRNRRMEPRMTDTDDPPTEQVDSQIDDSTHCAICLEGLGDKAVVMPCGHQFDKLCISHWIRCPGVAAKQCPLCRVRMRELGHTFDDQGNFRMERAGPVIPLPLQAEDEGPSDEDITPGMSERDRHAARERHRLRQSPEFRAQYDEDYLDITLIFVFVKNLISFMLREHSSLELSRRSSLLIHPLSGCWKSDTSWSRTTTDHGSQPPSMLSESL